MPDIDSDSCLNIDKAFLERIIISIYECSSRGWSSLTLFIHAAFMKKKSYFIKS